MHSPFFPTTTSATIFGVGVDLCKVERIQAVYAKFGQKFVRRILTEEELHLFTNRVAQSYDRGMRFLAGRFAAKEAFAKACGSGIRGAVGFQAISVVSDVLGKPFMQLDSKLTKMFLPQNVQAHLSLSDEDGYVLAYCVIEVL